MKEEVKKENKAEANISMDSTTTDYVDQLNEMYDEYDKKYSDKELLQAITDLRQKMRTTGETAKDDVESQLLCELLETRGYGFYFTILQDLDDYEQLRHEHAELKNKYTALMNLYDAAKHIIGGA